MMRAEITYDLVMDGEMAFVEGCYRLDGQDWQVFVFIRSGQVHRPEWRRSVWESGVTGLVVEFPRTQALNRHVVESVLSDALGVAEWVEARGPDSIQLR